jgi:signal transduction histidine kinase
MSTLTLPPPAPMSLARRFLAANLVVVLAASLAVAAWVGIQVEHSVINRTAAITGLYIESFVEPQIEALAAQAALPRSSVETLDSLITSTQLGERVVSFRVWTPDGTIVYSPDRTLIGQQFEAEGGLARALAGEVSAEMSDLSGPENARERQRWSRLLETYVPVRERGGGRIIGVTEFYQATDDIDAEVRSARLSSWGVVALVAVLSYLLLAGIVKQGSDTILRQQASLGDRVNELSRLLELNARLHRRLQRAADRTTALNEAGLRRIGSDLHDGPAQTLSLALLRRDEPDAGAIVPDAVSRALEDLRLIASGLRSPDFDAMTVAEVVGRAVREHERRTGQPVALSVGEVPAAATDVVKIGLYRVLQEALSNASRHAAGAAVEVRLDDAGAAIRLVIRDHGPGFDPALARPDALGIAGMRERAELMGGSFDIASEPQGGTTVVLTVPTSPGVGA